MNKANRLVVLDQKKIDEWDEIIKSLVEQLKHWVKNAF